MLEGLIDEMAGTTVGWVIVKGKETEVPPPGGGLETVTWTVPGVLMSEVEIAPERLMGFRTVVGFATPLKLRTAVVAKLVPDAEIPKGSEPATMVEGKIEVSVGTG